MLQASSPYVELRCRSAFSFLGGASLPEDLVARAASLGYPALALGDRDGVYGAPRFWKSARAAGIRPLVAAEVTLAESGRGRERPTGPAEVSRTAPAATRSRRLGPRLLLLVESRTGYRNLCKLLTLGHSQKAKGESAVTWDELEAHASGLLCLAGSGASPLTRALRRREPEAARALGRRLGSIFARRLWIDVQRSFDSAVERRSRALADLARELRIPLVASGDVRHATASERPVLDVLSCLGQGTSLDGVGRGVVANAERYLVAPEEMARRFADLPGVLRATLDVAERCEFTLDGLGYQFPEFPLPPGQTPIGYLRNLTFAGASERYGSPPLPRVRSQLEHELAVIGKLGLAGYFLIVWDIVRFCREQGILVQGRGSAANSAVCYSLGITAVDAVGMNLLFERFLSEERGEWPDIDLDLPSGPHREEVIQYVYGRYGGSGADVRRGPSGGARPAESRTIGAGVAMTANVITYRTRSAVREAGKALGFSPLQIDRLAKLLANHGFRDDHDTLSAQLRAGGIDTEAPRVKLLVQCVTAMQGLPRHLGQHSGGMVIAAGRLDEIVPLEPAAMPGRSVVQWDKDDCADLGLIKIDLLGLGMMAALEEAIPLVRRAEGVELDLARLPQDDPKTYAMIRRADTIGVFQIESRAQMATLPRLKPQTFYDLVVEVAIIRPGPIVGQMVHPYLNRRAGREPITYSHPDLEPILCRTLGVPLFQEQLLRIAMTVAGFTGGEAEELRRAMGFKRSAERMHAIEAKLRAGLAAHGIVDSQADEIVRGITSFALYGFPESHAASFALLAYASAYLKAHHPAAFLCALLNAWPMGFYHPSTLVKDAQRHGVEVLPIDVRRSAWCSTIETRRSARRPGPVRIGLRFVRGLREEGARRLEDARRERSFRDAADLAARAMLTRGELTALAELGALAGLGSGDRRSALWQVAALPRADEPLLAERARPSSSTSLPLMSPLDETLADYRASGLTTGPHLMAHLRSSLAARGIVPLARLGTIASGRRVTTAGAVIVRQRPGTAKGICFLTLEDETGTGNAMLTAERFERYRAVLHTSGLLILEGLLERHDSVTHLRVERLRALDGAAALPPSHDFH
ncbi:MAG TPA: error-prone DNA polymerase [Candidatus Bathyarchaeia archaeon]|nr:error-prone DNA polymerase [Candidatus Bathyarchaeia archaeon]